MRAAGLILLPYAAVIAVLGTRATITRRAVWAVIAVNGIWVADSLILLASAWVSPTALGYAFVLAQALAVLVFAEAQYFGLRRSPRAGAHAA